MTRVGIIFGGKSTEHEVSLMSATSAINAIDKTKYEVVQIGITKKGEWKLFKGDPEDIENGKWEEMSEKITIDSLKELIDIAFPILHGAYGEDGTIQGLFEMLDIPYAGCGVLGSACAMDKIVAKDLFVKAGIPSCEYIATSRKDFKISHAGLLSRTMGFPMFVKPANFGSSIGITRATEEEQLIIAVRNAAKYDRRVIVEKGINAREMEIGVIGNDELTLSAIGEIIPSAEFYDYKAKYFDGGKSKLLIPADIKEETKAKIREYAEKAYKALDCQGFARCDFLIDKETEEVYINEVNTIPGFTKYSMFPLLFEEAGIPYDKLIERIIKLGHERYNLKNNK